MDIKKKRTKLKWSQMELSRRSGVGRFNISLAETNQRALTKEEKQKITQAFKGASQNGSTNNTQVKSE